MSEHTLFCLLPGLPLFLLSLPLCSSCHIPALTVFFPKPFSSLLVHLSFFLPAFSLHRFFYLHFICIFLLCFPSIHPSSLLSCCELVKLQRAGGQDVRKQAPMKGNGLPPCLYKARWSVSVVLV